MVQHPIKQSPVANIELNRKAMSDEYFTPDANLNYAIIWVVVQTTIAFWIYSNNERRLLTL